MASIGKLPTKQPPQHPIILFRFNRKQSNFNHSKTIIFMYYYKVIVNLPIAGQNVKLVLKSDTEVEDEYFTEVIQQEHENTVDTAQWTIDNGIEYEYKGHHEEIEQEEYEDLVDSGEAQELESDESEEDELNSRYEELTDEDEREEL